METRIAFVITIALLLAGVLSVAASPGYTYYAAIVVDKTKVGETDADFTVLVSGVYDGTGGEPDLRVTGSGGHIQNTASGGASGSYTVPADLDFGTDTACSSGLDFEIEKYVAATGEIVAWVQSGVSTTSDTTFYMCYGDASVSTSQESVAAAWDTNYIMVQHMADTTTSAISDSAGGGSDGTKGAATEPTEASGKIAQAQNFDGNEIITITNESTFDFAVGDPFTLSAWARSTYTSTTHSLISKYGVGDVGYYFALSSVSGSLRPYFRIIESGTGYYLWVYVVTGVGDGGWHHLTVTYSGSGNTAGVAIYVDGAVRSPDGTGFYGITKLSGNILHNEPVRLGSRQNIADLPLNGDSDENRISDIVRSAGHVLTCYNNQDSPSTFYTMGAETLWASTSGGLLSGLSGLSGISGMGG